MRVPSILLLSAACAFGEVHTLTLAQALDRALAQNPDLVIARLDQQRARAQVDVTRDPYYPKVGVGSGLAYTIGFPASIDGNAPSIFQARGQMALYDKPLSYRVQQSRELATGAGLDVTARQQDIAYRVSTAFLDAENAIRSAAAADRQAQSLAEVKRFTDLRVADGRELRVESTRANVNVLSAQNTAEEFGLARDNAQAALAQLLGYPAGDLVRPALEERETLAVIESREQATSVALAQSLDIRKLESNLKAKQLEIKSYEATRWYPKINLVAQYSVLSRFNNFDIYYPRFQRNNAQFGASIELPLFTGKTASAAKTQAEIDIEKLQTELARTRSKIAADIDQTYRDLERAERTRNLQRARLDLAREDLSIVLTQYDEGRATMAQVEAARAKEQEEWIRYYDSQRAVELARLNVRRTTGTILADAR